MRRTTSSRRSKKTTRSKSTTYTALTQKLKHQKQRELLQIESQFNSHVNECNELNGFLVKAVGMVKKAANHIQSEYQEIDDLELKRADYLREKERLQKEIDQLDEENQQQKPAPKPDSTVEIPNQKEPTDEQHQGEYYEPSEDVDENLKEEFRKDLKAWEEEVAELDHQEVRMLEKVRKLESIVENTNLIINYIENHGSIHLSQLDNFIVNPDSNYEASKMNEIDDLCLNSSEIRNKNPAEKYELITKDMVSLRKATDGVVSTHEGSRHPDLRHLRAATETGAQEDHDQHSQTFELINNFLGAILGLASISPPLLHSSVDSCSFLPLPLLLPLRRTDW